MTIIIKGIETRDENGNPYVRLDIDDWYTDQVTNGGRKQLTLFTEALALIQKRPLDNLLSYFRLAGIHSAPWCKWDDVDLPPDDPKRIKGYCVHNNYTFPTWHRVYMLLYERALYDAMYEWIGAHVPASLQTTWKQEADKWRLPYWDFARFAKRPPLTVGAFENDIDHDRLRLPILCMMPSVETVVFSDDGKEEVRTRPNPLYKYVTPKVMGQFPAPYTITGEKIPEETIDDPKIEGQKKVVNPPFTYPWDKCYATTKYGLLDGFDASIWADGGQNWLRANYALNEHPYYGPVDESPKDEDPVPTVQDLVFRLFQYGLDSWGAFSSSRYTSDDPEPPESSEGKPAGAEIYTAGLDEGNAKNAMNLEFIHNNIHNFVGGTQFLRPPKESIHLWGAGHMSSVFMSAFDPIFFIFHNNIDRLTAIWQSLNWDKWFDDEYSKQTKGDLLTPFHKDAARNFWKSDDVREWTPLGYDYKILHGRAYKDGDDEEKIEEDRKKILKDIEGLYGKETKNLFDGLPEIDGDDDYVITVIYDRYALNGAPYKINLFLKDTDKSRGPNSEGFIASVYNFSGSLDSGPCGNCQQQKEEGVKAIAQVPATVPMRRHLRKTRRAPKEAPQPVYLALNTLGNPVKMDVHVGLHRSRRPYYANPIRPVPGDPLKYDFLKHGKQSEEVFTSVAAS